MLLVGENGTRFGLRVVAYEFPQRAHGAGANWLVVEIEADDGGAAWRVTGAFLLTDELRRLALWLRSIALGGRVRSSLEFCEPDLAFELVEARYGRVWLRFFLDRYLRPPWSSRGRIGDWDMFVNVFVDHESLSDASVDLLQQLVRYPERDLW